MNNTEINNAFLRSALTQENPFISTQKVVEWVEERKNAVDVSVNPIPFKKLTEWVFDEESKNLRHKSGKFFSIDGISVSTNHGGVKSWQQPIINQPEVGLLGIITKLVDGVLFFLLQAKVEPGNIGKVQLAPTLQATESNYTRVHKGIKPLFLNYFLKPKRGSVLLNQLQSEQGARFLKKRNRNIIVITEDDISGYADFIWLTLGQIKKLMKVDNLVNMDTRTVVAGIPYGKYSSEQLELFDTYNIKTNENAFSYDLLRSALDFESSLHTFDGLLSWFNGLKSQYKLEVQKTSLMDLKDWKIGSSEITHHKNKYFKVFAADIKIGNREVKHWQQPLIKPVDDGIIAFVMKKINGVMHFLVQAKLESGNFDVLEMAPTVQCITDSYDVSEDLPFLNYVLSAEKEQIKFDTMQSEEGGRFYREQNRNMIIQADESFPIELPPKFAWLTINQLGMFLKFNNYLNIQARSLIAAIDFIDEFDFLSGEF